MSKNKKRFNSKLYTLTRLKYTKEDGWHYVTNNNDYLFAESRYPTKIQPTDLPEWYVQGRYYKCHGFLSSKNVKYVVYKPNYFTNHFHKDDLLYVSFDAPIERKEVERYGLKSFDYVGYDYVISGGQIIDYIVAIKKWSNYDTDEIENELIKKSEWFMQTYPDDPEARGSKHVEYLKELFGK